MKPLRVEHVSHSQAQERMRVLGARYAPQRSEPNRSIYHSKRYNVWLELVPRAGGYTLKFFSACPCGG